MTASQISDAPCFVHVCQAGELEVKSVVLAASLRRHFGPAPEIVAAVPYPAARWGEIDQSTRSCLQEYSVDIIPITNLVSDDYPIGNKIDCLSVDTLRKQVVFLDTDILALRSGDLSALCAKEVGAVPASGTHLAGGDWPAMYAQCGAPYPATRMTTLVSGQETPPYFNSGVLSLRSALARDFGLEWARCARSLLEFDGLPRAIRTRFLDQVSLPISAARLRLAIGVLGPEWNFPSWSWSLGERDRPCLFHYQQLGRLFSQPETEQAFFSLLEESDLLKEIVLRHAKTQRSDVA